MYAEDIKDLTKENTNFRKVLHTGVHSQIVAMSILPGEDIGKEVHPDIDQIFYFVSGECQVEINGETRQVEKHDIVFVPAGAMHNFTNIGDEALKLFTVYSPPQHPEGTVHVTKADAQASEGVH